MFPNNSSLSLSRLLPAVRQFLVSMLCSCVCQTFVDTTFYLRELS